MSQDLISFYRTKMRRMGRWMFPRYLRNRGVSFEDAHIIIFGRPPRLV